MADQLITGLEVTWRDERAVSWTPTPRAVMECHSHALLTDQGTWLIDPLDVPGLDDLLEELAPIVGVIVLLDRHRRDAKALAERFDVPLFMPEGTRTRSAQLYHDTIPGSPFEVRVTRDGPGWHERALWWADERVLVAADVIGTARYFRVGDDALAVHPLLRLLPPTSPLRDLDPELVLVGHGPPLHDSATAALKHALGSSRRRSMRLAVESPARLWRWGASSRNGC